MVWRKWFVRLLVFGIVGGCAGAVLLYQRFTNPAAVREQVLSKLRSLFPGAVVTADSARLRILGGISVNELRLARKDDPDKSEILHVPSAVIYHDKEKILEGELALRKIELYRPHLRAQRDKDGAWNLQGISGTFQPNVPMATIVVYQGTLLLEDRGRTGTKTVELTDVELRLVNDPLDTVVIDGSANSDVAGKVRLQGHWQRLTKEITLTLKAEQISLAGIVLERLQQLCPAGTLDGLKLEGTANLLANLAYNPLSARPLAYDVSLDVIKAKLRHPKVPLPLDDLDASIRCLDGELRLEKLLAKSGATDIEASGTALLAAIDQTFECHLLARHLEMRQELFDCLPDKMKNLYALFSPTGPATFRADLIRRDGTWATFLNGEPAALQLLPENMGVTCAKFRYPLERLSGAINMNLLTKLVQVDVTGHSGARPVFISGTWQGEGADANGRIEIHADAIPLDEKLVRALPVSAKDQNGRPSPNFQKLADSFHATGKGDIKALIRHEPGTKEFHNEFHVRFHDTAIRWELFPLPLENITAYLDIYPKRWEFREGRGSHRGCEVFVEGSSLHREAKDGAPSPGLLLNIVGRNLAVDEELRRALEPMKLGRSWDTFRPSGRLSFKARIDHRTDDPEDADIHLEVRGGTIEPVFFKYILNEIAGTFHYHKSQLEISAASARHQGARLTLDKGTVHLHRGGGYYTELEDLTAENLVLDEDLLQALPAESGKNTGGLRGGMHAFKLRGPLTLKTRLVVSQGAEPGSLPDIYWDGQGWLKDADFHTGLEWKKVTGVVGTVGRHNGRRLLGVNGNVLVEEATLLGQPFRDLQARFQVKESAPEVLLVDLKAPLFGGDVSGEARIEFNSTLRYELNLTGSQIDLGQFGRFNLGDKSQLQGAAMARLHLTGQGTDSETLDGQGSIDLPSGRLYNLPLLLDILKFIGLRPERTAFEEVHAQFSIHGKRVNMRKLEILGNAISLTGQGEFNRDGTDVALDFYPGWARLDQLLPAAVRPFPPAVGKNLLTIQMRGSITANEKDRKFTLKPVPAIVDPILHMRQRLTGTGAPDNREEPRPSPAFGGGK